MRPYEPDKPDDRNPWDKNEHPEHYSYIQSLIEHVDRELVRPPKYDEDTKLKVFQLRDEGYTLRQIAETVGVSKSTACLWTKKREAVPATKKIKVTQPGTTKTVTAEYSLNEVNVGKLTPKESEQQVG